MRPFKYGANERSLYQEHASAIEDRAKKMAESVIGSSEDSVDLQSLRSIFHLEGIDFGDITPSERNDFKNFVRYATKRLAAGTIVSPMHQASVHAGETKKVLDGFSPPAMVRHDLIHTMVAYGENDAHSLVPAFMKTSAKDQITDPRTIQEEMIAALFQTDTIPKAFLQNFLKTHDSRESYMKAFNCEDEKTQEGAGAFVKYVATLKPSQASNPLEYYLGAYEEYFFNFLQRYYTLPKDAEYSFEEARRYIETHRSPLYVSVVRRMYENSLLEQPDPKIMFHIFQDILRPLLERLRRQNGKINAA